MKRVFLLGIVFLLSIFSVYSELFIADPLNVGYYTFDSTLSDSTGTMNDMTNNGATYTPSGKINGAYDYDGSDDMTVSYTPSLNYAVSVWFNSDIIPSTSEDYIYSTGGSGTARNRIYITPAREIICSIGSGMVTTGVTMNFGNWYFVTNTFNQTSNTGHCIVNGVDYSASLTFSSPTTSLTVGDYSSGFGRNFDGRIDELSFWNKTLSLADHQTLYNSGVGCQYDFSACVSAVTPPVDNDALNVYALDTFDINLSTNTPVNLSYVLDDGPLISLGTNTTNEILQLSNVSVGNHSLGLLAVNEAGQRWTNLTFKVQPSQFFRFFNLDDSTFIEDYTFGGIESVGEYVSIDAREVGLGNISLEFDKPAFPKQNFTFTLNLSSQLNQTFNVSLTTITVNIFDRATESLRSDLVELQLIGPSGGNGSTNNGTFVFKDINREGGDYQLIASSAAASTETLFFTYNDQQAIDLNVYMSNTTDTSTITIEVKDTLGNFIESAVVSLLEWKVTENAFISVGQCETNAGGKCNLNIELNTKLYKFQAEKAGSIVSSNSQIINVDESTLTLTLTDATLEVTSDLENLRYNFTETLGINLTTVRFQWVDTDGLVSKACLKVIRQGNFLLNSTCTSSSSGILFISSEINQSKDISVEAFVYYEGREYPIDSFIYAGSASFSSSVENTGLALFVAPVFALLAIGFGIFFANIYAILASLSISQWLAFVLLPNVISMNIAILVTVMSILISWGAYRR